MDSEVKRGQATVWIILAIVLVAVIILFLSLSKNLYVHNPASKTDLDSYISSCIAPSIEEATKVMLPRGGLLKKQNTVTYNFQEVEYMCVNMGFYERCINQHPLLIKEMEDELKDYLKPRIDICFDELKKYIEDSGEIFSFSLNYDLKVSLVPDKIVIDIERDSRYVSKEGQERNVKNFLAEYTSGAQGLATVALEISAQEATYCYFESTGFSLYYPRYKITRHQLSVPVKIYKIEDKLTGEYMMIAIRSCAMPAGV